MIQFDWLAVAATACLLGGCISAAESNANAQEHTQNAQSAPPTGAGGATNRDGGSGSSTGSGRHLRVLVAYENGAFAVQKVTEVAGDLRAPRGNLGRTGLRFVARGAGAFSGHAPDPRTIRAEFPNADGGLEFREIAAPGQQHVMIEVPAGSEALDLHEGREEAPANGARAAAPPATPIATLDLRGHR